MILLENLHVVSLHFNLLEGQIEDNGFVLVVDEL